MVVVKGAGLRKLLSIAMVTAFVAAETSAQAPTLDELRSLVEERAEELRDSSRDHERIAPNASQSVIDSVAHGLSGSVEQPGAQPYAIRIWKEADIIRVEYPRLDCGGDWLVAHDDPSKAIFTERITRGKARCIDGGTVVLTRDTDGGLHYHWSDAPGGPAAATARLTPMAADHME